MSTPGSAPTELPRCLSNDKKSQALGIRRVAANLYCGARPDADMMQHLKRIGIKTIINLEDYNTYWGWFGWRTRDMAAQAGISMIRQPMSPIFRVCQSRVEKIIDVLGDASRAPFYVHCLFGKERTNFVVALHRRLIDAFPEKVVRQAMYRDGFRAFLVPALAAQAGELLHNPTLIHSSSARLEGPAEVEAAAATTADGTATADGSTASPPRLARPSVPSVLACLAAPQE